MRKAPRRAARTRGRPGAGECPEGRALPLIGEQDDQLVYARLYGGGKVRQLSALGQEGACLAAQGAY